MLVSHGCDIENIQVKGDLHAGFQRINMKLKFPKDKGLYKTLMTDWTEELAIALREAKCTNSAMDDMDEWIPNNKAWQVQEFLKDELPPAIYHGAKQKMKSLHKVITQDRKSNKLKQLVECIRKSLNVNLDLQQTMGFYETMKSRYLGKSTLASILSAINVMDGILGREQKFVMINGKKELWPMGNCEEIFRAIGRTMQIYSSLGKLGPFIENIIATQSNLCSIEPSKFIEQIIQKAKQLNKYEQLTVAPADQVKETQADTNTNKGEEGKETTKTKPEKKKKLKTKKEDKEK